MSDTAGTRIKERRLKLGLSQEAIAERIGISQSAYNRYEKDQIRRFSQKSLENLALALETTPEYIIGADDPEIRLSHFPLYMQKFILNPASLGYVAEAYRKYQQDMTAENPEEKSD